MSRVKGRLKALVPFFNDPVILDRLHKLRFNQYFNFVKFYAIYNNWNQ